MDSKLEGLWRIEVPAHSQSLIYYLMQGDEVVYVGKTEAGLSRPFSHDFKKEFDSVIIEECPSEMLDEAETAAIIKYKPRYNKAVGYGYYSLNSARNAVRDETGVAVTLRDIKRAISELEIETYSNGFITYVTSKSVDMLVGAFMER